jgi:hypothetical protein
MNNNLITYRITIDVKSYDSRNDLRKWISDTIEQALDTERGEEIVETYVDETRT